MLVSSNQWGAAQRRARPLRWIVLSFISCWLITASSSEAVSATCFEPAEVRDGLIRAEAPDDGFDHNALCALLDKVRDSAQNVHSVLVLRKGQLVAELYRPGRDGSIYSLWYSRVDFGPNDLHDMRSISKSIVGLLYGILLARGEVPDLSTPVTSLYPEYPGFDQSPRRAIEIRHLLTMSSGLEWNEPSPTVRTSRNDEVSLAWTWRTYRYVFQREIVAAPGKQFTYSAGATAVLADIMVRATKKPLREIARTELFEPLGITEWQWVGDLYGSPMASAGLRLKPRDLMKIGSMMLAGGTWQSRRVVPAEWIPRSVQRHIPVGGGSAYGFQWWSIRLASKGRELVVGAAIGNGGQRLFLVPDLELAVVMTGGAYDDRAIGSFMWQLFGRIVDTVTP